MTSSSHESIYGILPALVTPMTDDGRAVNHESLGDVVEFLIGRGVDGFFVCGGTGEGLLLRPDERRAILETVVARNAGRTRLVAHIGALATMDAAELAAHAASMNVDAVAAVPPVYFRVDDAGLVDHYRLIADAAGETPLWVYNIPGATGVEINAAAMTRLLDIPTVAGIKYSSYDLYDMRKIIDLDARLTVHSGFDQVCVAGLTMGAHGAIGTTYNVMPATFARLYRAARAEDWATAQSLQARANRVIQALQTAPILAGVKAVLSHWGMPCGAPRRPLRPLTEEERTALIAAVEAVDLAGLEAESLAALKAG